MVICGIDYSLTSPALTVHSGDTWHHSNCKFFYIVQKKSAVVTAGQFVGSVHQPYDIDPQRYDNLGNWALDIIKSHSVTSVGVEGYAFGAVGRVFQIAENTGTLKSKMWNARIPYSIYPPSEIKKFATGNGNASKEKMCDAFLAETSIDIRKELCMMKPSQWNPLSDIVDSYYIAKLRFFKEIEHANHS